MGRYSLLVGILRLEVVHHFSGFLVPEPLIVVYKDISMVLAARRHLLGNGWLNCGFRRGGRG
ncbi:hypothetical protein GCM10010523_03080 [Paenarthrobacter ilicis]